MYREVSFLKKISISQILFRDQSGSINHKELQDALSSFGYNLSSTVYSLLIRKFDRTNKQAVKFDDFIQCCLVLHVSQILKMKNLITFSSSGHHRHVQN